MKYFIFLIIILFIIIIFRFISSQKKKNDLSKAKDNIVDLEKDPESDEYKPKE